MTRRNDNRVTVADLDVVIAILADHLCYEEYSDCRKAFLAVVARLQRERFNRIAQREARKKATERRSRRASGDKAPHENRHHHKR